MTEDKEYELLRRAMSHKSLADEMEKVSPGIKAEISGYLLSQWLPSGWGRKIAMAIIFLIAVLGSFKSTWFLLLLLLLPLFSPRIVGEVARFFGKLK